MLDVIVFGPDEHLLLKFRVHLVQYVKFSIRPSNVNRVAFRVIMCRPINLKKILFYISEVENGYGIW